MANIKDVAQYANVSISTVSIVINGKSKERKISKETQARVRQAMKELNYHPNLSAKKLRSSQNKKTIALFWTTDFRDIMLARFLGGLQSAIKELNLDYDIIIYPYENNKLCQEKSLTQISNYHGAIIANANQKDLDFLNSLNPMIPIVLYNRNLDNYSSVSVDDESIAEVAYQLLQKHQNIGIIRAPYAFDGMQVRDQKLIELLNGKTVEDYFVQSNNAKGGYEIAKSINFQSLDVLYTVSDMIALGIMHYCYENHIMIPSDVEILSIGNGLTTIDEYLNPALSIIEIPMEKMAKECIKILSQLFEKSIIIKQNINPQIIIRDSFTQGDHQWEK